VQISGWSYFAITPHSVQAGGGLDVVLDADPLRAWCHAEAHFLIHWKPFFYDVHLYVDFGVSFRMDMLFCTVTITADISADLEIWGPAFTGHAEVHLWFVSFGIDFGAGASRDLPKCEWPEFVSAFLTPAPPARAPHALHALHAQHPMAAAADAAGTPVLEIIPVNGTRVAPAESGHDWYADPQTTTLKVKTTMPAKTAALNTEQIAHGEGIKIFAKPVTNSPQIDPHLHVRVEEQFGTKWRATKQLQARPAVTNVPTALWGASGQPGELTPGLTDVHLAPNLVVADSTAEVPVAGLLFEDARPIAAAWQHPPAVPADAFDWATSNPFRTIDSEQARQSRTAMLADLAAMGYVKAGAIAAIDFTNFKPEQPCFMANPALCRLGAETTAV
jgi:hypothetical protein